MPTLRLFAMAREAAGLPTDRIDAGTVGEVLALACERYGDEFALILGGSRVWVNGQPADNATAVTADDVVAVLPPVSGGSATARTRVNPAVTARLGLSDRLAPVRPLPTFTPPVPAAPPAQARAPVNPPVTPATPREPNATAPPPGRPRTGPPDVPLSGASASPAAHDAQSPVAVADAPAEVLSADRSLPGLARGWLGITWTLTTALALAAGPGWLAAWLAAASAVAAAQVACVMLAQGRRAGPASVRRPLLVTSALVTAGSIPLAAVAGLVPLGMALGGCVLVTLFGQVGGSTEARAAEATRVHLAAAAVGLAASSMVLVRGWDVSVALFLLAAVAAYDASVYLIGTGATSWWEGPAAGAAAIVPVTMVAVATITAVGSSDVVALGVAAAGLAPAGAVAGRRLLGSEAAVGLTPTLRRFLSLLVLGPVWVILVNRFLG